MEAPDEVNRVSPLQSIDSLSGPSACRLGSLASRRAAGRAGCGADRAEMFDPAARELTAEAAAAVGLERLVLLEEPQAALYHWILAWW